MISNLTSEEESYLQELLNSRGRGIPALAITANLLLVFGGLLIVGTALFIARHLTDEVVYSVGLPNVVGGLLLIAGYVVFSRRAAHLKRLTSLLSKLASMGFPPNQGLYLTPHIEAKKRPRYLGRLCSTTSLSE